MLLKELQTWIEIYNKYKSKMPLYYMHSKTFHPLFKSLLEKTSKLKNVKYIYIYNFQKLNIKSENYIDILGDYIYEKTGHFEYKQILKILTYGDIVFQETKFDEVQFIPFSLVLDEEKNYNNIKYVQKALSEENKYFEEQIETLKEILDKATDLCETKGFLQKDVLEELNNYLKNNNNEILINFQSFYEENMLDDKNQ